MFHISMKSPWSNALYEYFYFILQTEICTTVYRYIVKECINEQREYSYTVHTRTRTYEVEKQSS